MKQLYIVAVAGSGKRMGLDTPKQFLEFDNEPIFIKTLKVISANKNIHEIIVVTKVDYIDIVKSYIDRFNIQKVRAVVEGGRERQDSIYNAIKIIDNIDEYIIGVQDGVRPFIKDDYIDKAYELLKKDNKVEGVVVAVAVKDTIKVVGKDGMIKETPQRASLIAAQTPQVFRAKILERAYREADREGYLGTDDASLVEKIGGRIAFIEGGYDNIKITTIEDLLHFQKRG